MDQLYDKFPHRNIISCTYSKLNTIKDGYSLNNWKKINIVTNYAYQAAYVPPLTKTHTFLASHTEEHHQRELGTSIS